MTAPATAIGDFGVTVDAVYRLVPEAERITDPNTSNLPNPITEATVAAWIVEVSDGLSDAIGDWTILTGSTGERIKAAARAAVANGVASYMEAARYPTQQSGYAVTLWARYQAMITALAATVTREIDEGGGDVVDPVAAEGGSAYAQFPATYFADGDPRAPWVQPCDPLQGW